MKTLVVIRVWNLVFCSSFIVDDFLKRDDSGEAHNGRVLLMLVFVNRGGNVSFCETQNLSISPPCLGISLLWSLYNIPTQYQKKNIDDLCFSSTLWRRNPRKIISNLDNLSSQYWWHSIAFITLVCNIGRERKKTRSFTRIFFFTYLIKGASP